VIKFIIIFSLRREAHSRFVEFLLYTINSTKTKVGQSKSQIDGQSSCSATAQRSVH